MKPLGFRGSEPFTFKLPSLALLCQKACLFIPSKETIEWSRLSFLRLLTSQLICKSPGALRCKQLRLWGLGHSGDAPRGQRLTTVLCNGGFHTETFPPVRAGTQVPQYSLRFCRLLLEARLTGLWPWKPDRFTWSTGVQPLTPASLSWQA